MDLTLATQIANLIALGIVELRVISANNAMNDAQTPVIKAALTENRPLTPDEFGAIEALADDAHRAVQGEWNP